MCLVHLLQVPPPKAIWKINDWKMNSPYSCFIHIYWISQSLLTMCYGCVREVSSNKLTPVQTWGHFNKCVHVTDSDQLQEFIVSVWKNLPLCISLLSLWRCRGSSFPKSPKLIIIINPNLSHLSYQPALMLWRNIIYKRILS